MPPSSVWTLSQLQLHWFYIFPPTPGRSADPNSPEAGSPECLASPGEYLVLLGERKAGGKHCGAHIHSLAQPHHGQIVPTEGISEVVVWMEVNLDRFNPYNVGTVLLHLVEVTHTEVDLEVLWVPAVSTNNQSVILIKIISIPHA